MHKMVSFEQVDNFDGMSRTINQIQPKLNANYKIP